MHIHVYTYMHFLLSLIVSFNGFMVLPSCFCLLLKLFELGFNNWQLKNILFSLLLNICDFWIKARFLLGEIPRNEVARSGGMCIYILIATR